MPEEPMTATELKSYKDELLEALALCDAALKEEATSADVETAQARAEITLTGVERFADVDELRELSKDHVPYTELAEVLAYARHLNDRHLALAAKRGHVTPPDSTDGRN
jgi:hypothetical protein